ncbi:uncharacterized protein TM35_000221150 [Trypanosoma theileri]|uniref:Uncharacterized protein n=1 Tax=Trypanosoma theileri TaxID=67003 RepID=A0A1X0NRI2_9TRYP|nr:uncharacterized protein TM35_000221150 [Trypanosoma theileri]ORC87316.1 hypothetical protein TM35_000221150 [Trypanosoma theileri]
MKRCYSLIWIRRRRRTTTTTLKHSNRFYVNKTPREETLIMEKYHLPLRRAFHFIEEGRNHQEHFAECEEDMQTTSSSSTSSTSTSEMQILQRDAARYAAYHCHHLLNSFRAERHRWTKVNELSFEDLTRVIEFIFFASLLLHLTALYETADKYCESLINLVFSCSVFISKDVHKLYQLYDDNRNCSSVETPSFPNVKSEGTEKDEPWDSLHWAVIHFTHGISKWGLLDHTESLFDMRKTTIPCCAMLRTFAKITRSILMMNEKMMILNKEEIRFLSYIATKEGSSRWLATSHNTVSLPSSSSSTHRDHKEGNTEVSICFAQQRRLQLLPLLWMALLARHSVNLHKRHQLYPSRHALLRALLLFSKEAKGDMVLTLLVRCLYFHPPDVRVSSVEMGVLLAQMERHEVFSSSLSLSSQSSSSSSSCVELLRLWMRMEKVQEDAPEAKSRRAVYIAFRNIPLCALQIVGDHYTSTVDGEAFVHELLLRALLQWSFRVSDNTSFKGELEELLLSAQHMVSLLEGIKLRESINKKEGASLLVVEAILRAFAVRVSVICRRKYASSEKSQLTLLEFDKILQCTLRKERNGSDTGSVPCVYEKNRHQWLKNL